MLAWYVMWHPNSCIDLPEEVIFVHFENPRSLFIFSMLSLI